MGFYDERCMVTGVSLKGSRSVAVLLGRTGVAYYPTALPIRGQYNRFGSIDMIDEDANTAAVLAHFTARLADGAFVISGDKSMLAPDRYPPGDVETLLSGFERNINNYSETAVLNGRPVVFALVCEQVWDAAAKVGNPGDGTNTERFAEVFRDVPVAEAMYAGKLTAVAKHLKQLAAVCEFLGKRGIAWRPIGDAGQHYDDDMRMFLVAARNTFADCPQIIHALEAYADDVADLLNPKD